MSLLLLPFSLPLMEDDDVGGGGGDDERIVFKSMISLLGHSTRLALER